MQTSVHFRSVQVLAASLAAGASTAALAQVLESGVSDPSEFTRVIDVTPGAQIPSFSFFGGVEGETTQLNVLDGGFVGRLLRAEAGTEVNLQSGGVIDRNASIDNGAEFNLVGGTLRRNFIAAEDSTINLRGGTVGGVFRTDSRSVVQLFGGEFRLNGAAFTDDTFSLQPGDVFTGTLEDGSAFIFSDGDRDDLPLVTLQSTTLPTASTTPATINTASLLGPSGLRAGQSLTLLAGGELGENVAVVDATLEVAGGTLGDGLEIVGSEVNISGGEVGNFLTAYAGSRVSLSGGSVGNGVFARDPARIIIGGITALAGSVVDISGGTVLGGFDASSGSEVTVSGGSIDGNLTSRGVLNIGGGEIEAVFASGSGSQVLVEGGTITDGLSVLRGSTAEIRGGLLGGGFVVEADGRIDLRGGTLANQVRADAGSVVNVFGTEFFLGGERLDDLTAGEAFTVTQRDVTLEGRLADGSLFAIDLDSLAPFSREPGVADAATLTVTLVPEPGSAALLGLASLAFGLRRRA